MLSSGVHSVLQTANVTVNVTLQGTSKNDVIIEGLSADDIARGSESPRFFQADCAVARTLNDISLRNFITTAADMWGGMCNVSDTSTLILQGVNIDKAKLPNTGGAIFSKSPIGNVSINNSIFESNSAVVEGTLNHTVKWPVVGDIVLRIYTGNASKLHVTNTLFNLFG